MQFKFNKLERHLLLFIFYTKIKTLPKCGIRYNLCSIYKVDGIFKAGPFGFSAEGILSGRKALDTDNLTDCDVVFIDEIGPLELSGNGWSECIDKIVKGYKGVLVIVVRESLIEKVRLKWFADIESIWNCKYSVPSEIVSSVMKRI